MRLGIVRKYGIKISVFSTMAINLISKITCKHRYFLNIFYLQITMFLKRYFTNESGINLAT